MLKRILGGTILSLFSFLLFSSFFSEEDPLNKRSFSISLSETRNGVVQKKVINDRLYFKNGKLYCEFIDNKFGFKWVRYRINRDTSFMDSTQTRVRLLALEAVATDENNQTLSMDLVQVEWDIEGVVKLTKNDKLKRYYDLSGREKGGKPKKEKKKKDKIFRVIMPGDEPAGTS